MVIQRIICGAYSHTIPADKVALILQPNLHIALHGINTVLDRVDDQAIGNHNSNCQRHLHAHVHVKRQVRCHLKGQICTTVVQQMLCNISLQLLLALYNV